MAVKLLGPVRIKSDDRGEVEAVFATFNVIDADGDVTLPGAFDGNDEVPISAYGHSSWAQMLPVGKAHLTGNDREAVLHGQFFMDTTDGRDTFTTVKHLGSLGQWSYGYDSLEFSFGQFDGQKVRFLSKQLVHEVSPVLVGSGVNTRTLSAKAGQHRDDMGSLRGGRAVKTSIRSHETDVVNQPWDRGEVVAAIPDGASIADLRSMAAWFDPSGDPEAKGSYKFWHHTSPNGPANVRACVQGIAVLNGSRGVDVGSTPWAEDREGIWNHLASHLRDADREPPELRAAAAGSSKDDGDIVTLSARGLVGLRDAIDALGRLVASANGKQRKLSTVKAEQLGWMDEELMNLHRRLRSYLDTPDDEAEHEFARFVALSHHIGGTRHDVSGIEGSGS